MAGCGPQRGQQQAFTAGLEAESSTVKRGMLPPLTNSWIISIIEVCKALGVTPIMDCWGSGSWVQGSRFMRVEVKRSAMRFRGIAFLNLGTWESGGYWVPG